MEKDCRDFVAACEVCARAKASHQPPAGLLHPLPVPGRPCSHIALDFVTGLPPSNGNTTILTVVDWFSKSVHLIPLPKLPSSLETARLLVHHVFCLHGIPQDIVSDRGPQFTSQVWKSFCQALGPQSACRQGTTPRPMDRPSGRTRTWGWPLGVWRTVTPPHGVPTSLGSSTHSTSSSALPLRCHHSCVPWASNLRSSHPWKKKWWSSSSIHILITHLVILGNTFININ